MSENVIHLVPPQYGDGAVLDVDRILEEAKGQYVKVTVVGQAPCGHLVVLGSHSAAESAMLLAWGQNYLVTNLTVR